LDRGIDHIARGRIRLDELARAAGRDPATITVRVLLIDRDENVNQKLVARYAEAGADQVHLLGSPRPPAATASERAGLDWLQRVAERVL
jgi:hypothetical protein